jgi:hypothetical protein
LKQTAEVDDEAIQKKCDDTDADAGGDEDSEGTSYYNCMSFLPGYSKSLVLLLKAGDALWSRNYRQEVPGAILFL